MSHTSELLEITLWEKDCEFLSIPSPLLTNVLPINLEYCYFLITRSHQHNSIKVADQCGIFLKWRMLENFMAAVLWDEVHWVRVMVHCCSAHLTSNYFWWSLLTVIKKKSFIILKSVSGVRGFAYLLNQ
jgi:hypothetical protein